MSSSENRQSTPFGLSGTRETQVKIPVLQEEISIGKESVDTGRGVRIEKHVREKPCIVDEIVRHEDVEVHRIPVDRMVSMTEVPQSRYEGDTLIIPVLEEVLVVEKRLRIKEEIRITKTTCEDHRSDVVHLKAEEISIEHFEEHKTGEKGGTPAD